MPFGLARVTNRPSISSSPAKRIETFSADGDPMDAGGRTEEKISNGRCFPGYCFARFDAAAALPVLTCTVWCRWSRSKGGPRRF
jgi:hypothetical protein